MLPNKAERKSQKVNARIQVLFLFPFSFLLFACRAIALDVSQLPPPNFPAIKTPASPNPKSFCPADLSTLIAQLLPDLPSYTNRVIQRSSDTHIPRYVILAGMPEFEPLPLGPSRTTTSGSRVPNKDEPIARSPQDPRQVFITTLERYYTAGGEVQLQQYHWLFLTQTANGWQLALMFSRAGYYPGGEPPTPPQESSDSVFAEGIRLWLRDCSARRR